METQQKAENQRIWSKVAMKTVSSHPWLDPRKAYAGMQAGTPGAAGAPAPAAAQAEECVGQLAAALAPWWNNAEIFIAYL